MKIKQAINNKYLCSQGYYKVDNTPDGFFSEQTVNAIPLQYDIVPHEIRTSVIRYLIEQIERHDGHLTTGIMGTKALIDVLPAVGYENLMYDIATKPDYPGWGFWIRNGATTHWQHWSGFPDHNHAMFGSIENFILGYVGGIRIPEADAEMIGFKKIHIAPTMMDRFSFVRCGIPTPYGMLESSWEREGGKISMKISIPAGSSGKFSLPKNASETVFVNGRQTQVKNNSIALPSGRHNLIFDLK